MQVDFQSAYLVYKHTCVVTGKSYIGQTKDMKSRTIAHRKVGSGCAAFRNAIQKYGWNNFTTSILAENLTIDQANSLEPKFICEHNTLSPNGYNLTSGGLNHMVSEETRQKISESNKGKHRQSKTPEQKAKISASLKGRTVPPDVIAKSAASRRGVKRDAAVMQRIAAANTGKFRTTEQCQRISKSLAGKPKSAEHKLKISMSRTGQEHKKVTCPHCNTVGDIGAMSRWHLNNCKFQTGVPT
jgi:hypothetical protein